MFSWICSLKPVSHQPCGSRAPVCDDKFLCFVRQPYLRCCEQHRKVARLLQRQKLNFRHVHFLCDLCVFSKRRKTAAWLPKDTQGVRTTDVNNAAKRTTAAENRTMTARLQCGNRSMYRFVLRQSCKFCMTVLRHPCM